MLYEILDGQGVIFLMSWNYDPILNILIGLVETCEKNPRLEGIFGSCNRDMNEVGCFKMTARSPRLKQGSKAARSMSEMMGVDP